MTSQKLNYGGQAVIEGVMMRGSVLAAVAVRNPAGDIIIHEEALNPALYRGWVSRVPFLRGLAGLWDALVIGTRALFWSANVAAGHETPVPSPQEHSLFVMTSMIGGIGLFFVMPATSSGIIGKTLGVRNKAGLDMLEGAIKLAALTGYLVAIGNIEEVRRVFAYHGAEHKTINAFEAGSDLTPLLVQPFPLQHPRCGTAFLLTVMVLSTFMNMVVGRPKGFWRLLLARLIMLPVIAGSAYELQRWAAKNMHDPTVRLLIAPNLALQNLTTRPPDDAMLEVAIAALQRVIAAENQVK